MKFFRRIKRKINSKYVAITASIIACISVGIFVLAAKETKFLITVDKDTATRGEQVTFTVQLDSEDIEYNSVAFGVEYDSDSLELVTNLNDVSTPSGFNVYLCGLDKDNSNIISCGGTKVGGFITGSKDLVTLTFKVKDSAIGDVPVNFVKAVVSDVSSGNEVPFNSTNENGKVHINVPVTNVTLANSDVEIDLGSDVKTSQIVLDTTPAIHNDTRVVNYKDYDDNIISVSPTGLITAKNTGNTDITVEAYGQTFTVHVKVVAHIQDIKLDETEKTLNLNDADPSYTFTATLLPEGVNITDDPTITWESSESNVASVEDGKVTAKNIGTTTITAKTTNGKQASAVVKVIAPAKNVEINESDFTLTKNNDNNTKQLTLTIDPDPTSDTITWEVDDDSVVRLSSTTDRTITVTAVGGGYATITVHVGEKSDTVKVTVDVAVERIELDVQASETIELYPTQKRTVTGTIYPSDATVKKINWSIAESNIATVDADGTITAVNPGNATLIAEAGGVRVTRTIKVLVPVSSFVVDQPNVTLDANTKQSIKVKTTILPDNTDVSKDIDWKSNNTSVATVVAGSNGEATITAVALGDTEVIGTLEDGSTVTVNVHVIAPITGVTLDQSEIHLTGKNSTAKLTATINPNPTSDDKTLTWESSANGIVKVENGVLTAVAKGHAIITVRTSNDKIATCDVYVTIPAEKVEINEGETLSIEKGTSSTLTATVTPSIDEVSDTLTWKSSNDDIVSVNPDGTILAKAAGKATITAKVGNVEDTIEVEVFVKINSFELESNRVLDILRGSTSTVVTTIGPADATEDKTITWTSEDENIATVSKDGVIKGVNKGHTTIKGTLKNGMFVEVDVTVNIIPITDMTAENDKLEMLKGDKEQLELVIEPEETTEKDMIKWKSSDEDIANVTNTGLVTAKREGKVTITATYEDIEVTFEVNVKEIHLESMNVVIPKDSLTVGEELQLQVALNPTNVTDELTFTYKSSDESIATVTDTGLVKGLKSGKVTITVTASNGVTALYDITINEVVSPKTGDNILYYVSALLISTSLIGAIIIKKRKTN